VVKTQFGYHIIELVKIDPVTLEAIRPEVEAVMREEEMVKLTQESLTQFSDLTYSQPTSLAPAAKAFGLTVRETGWLTRDELTADPVLGNATLLKQLFDSASLAKKRNTDVVEIEGNRQVAARVASHMPKKQIPLEQVKETIAAQLKNQKAEAMAQAAGRALMAKLKADPNQAVAWESLGEVSRFSPQNLPDVSVTQILTVDVSSLTKGGDSAKRPVITGNLTGNGFAVYRITAVSEMPVDPVRRAATLESGQAELTQLTARNRVTTYRAALRARWGVTVNGDMVKRIASPGDVPVE
jgi:peptidyl-prolyl cis-trans isomerase D